MNCFISYAAPDITIAHALKERLSRTGLTVFLAADSIPPGANWRPIIPASVVRSELVLLLDSNHSRQSPWVQQEAGMAHASGSLLIPIAIDGKPEKLPGWLADIEAISLDTNIPFDTSLDQLVADICRRLGTSLDKLPVQLQTPVTVADAALKIILMDQFSGPEERTGAWSRQYDRYLRLYYGDTPVRQGVSQSASLTFSGMVVERLAAFASTLSDSAIGILVGDSIRHAETFILASQDPLQGGFGRLSSDFRSRAGRALQLDLRHTCWAIRALLAIDKDRFAPQINDGIRWLCIRAKARSDEDRWCWSAAPLLALLMNSDLRNIPMWQETSDQIRVSVQTDLEESFDPTLRSWVKGEGEEMRRSACNDNALYVLYSLKRLQGLSPRLTAQMEASIEGIIAKSSTQIEGRGVPLFGIEPEVGPTAQLLEITGDAGTLEYSMLANFVVNKLRAAQVMPQTFSWHLTAVLALPDICARKL